MNTSNSLKQAIRLVPESLSLLSNIDDVTISYYHGDYSDVYFNLNNLRPNQLLIEVTHGPRDETDKMKIFMKTDEEWEEFFQGDWLFIDMSDNKVICDEFFYEPIYE